MVSLKYLRSQSLVARLELMDIIPEQLFTHNDYVTVSIQRVMHANWRVDIVPPPAAVPHCSL